jgi:hypothetical protein
MELPERFFAKTNGALDLQNIKKLAWVLGVKIPPCTIAQVQYNVKYFIISLSVRTRHVALVGGNEGVGECGLTQDSQRSLRGEKRSSRDPRV